MANMTISVEDSVKREFSSFCSEVGLTASSVLNVCMVTIARERRIPFPIRAPRRPSLAERQALSDDIEISRREIAEGKGIPGDVVHQHMIERINRIAKERGLA